MAAPEEKCDGQDSSRILVERLIAWGIDTIFGIPGDGVNVERMKIRDGEGRFIFNASPLPPTSVYSHR
jgi:hypothetical protein